MTTAMRFFNTAGPIKAEIHYHVQLLARLDVEVGQSACLGVDPGPAVASERAGLRSLLRQQGWARPQPGQGFQVQFGGFLLVEVGLVIRLPEAIPAGVDQQAAALA